MEDGRIECARILLEARADVNGRNPANGHVVWTPLMLACDYGHPRCVELLLEHGADPGICLHPDNVEKGDPTTAMQFAEDGGAREAGGKRCAAALRKHDADLQSMHVISERPWEGKYLACSDKADAGADARECKDVSVALGLKEKNSTKTKAGKEAAEVGRTEKKKARLEQVREAQAQGDEGPRSKLVLVRLFASIRGGNASHVAKWLSEGGRDEVSTVHLRHGIDEWYLSRSPLAAAA
jgi:hypothetical protein